MRYTYQEMYDLARQEKGLPRVRFERWSGYWHRVVWSDALHAWVDNPTQCSTRRYCENDMWYRECVNAGLVSEDESEPRS